MAANGESSRSVIGADAHRSRAHDAAGQCVRPYAPRPSAGPANDRHFAWEFQIHSPPA